MIEARGRQTWMAWTGLALLIRAVYLSGLRHPFHYDDIHSIVDNLHIRTLGNIPAFSCRSDAFCRGSSKRHVPALNSGQLRYKLRAE